MSRRRERCLRVGLVTLVVAGLAMALGACQGVFDPENDRVVLGTDRQVYARGETVRIEMVNWSDRRVAIECPWPLERWREDRGEWIAAFVPGCLDIYETLAPRSSKTRTYGIPDWVAPDGRYRIRAAFEGVAPEESVTNEFQVELEAEP